MSGCCSRFLSLLSWAAFPFQTFSPDTLSQKGIAHLFCFTVFMFFKNTLFREKKSKRKEVFCICRAVNESQGREEPTISGAQHSFMASGDTNPESLMLCRRVLNSANFLFIVQIAFVNKSREQI